jgi:hypothetical protein
MVASRGVIISRSRCPAFPTRCRPRGNRIQKPIAGRRNARLAVYDLRGEAGGLWASEAFLTSLLTLLTIALRDYNTIMMFSGSYQNGN